jgi:hypothetical protein
MSVDYIAFRSTRKPTIVIVFGISDACAGKPLQVIVANAAMIVGFDIKALDCFRDMGAKSVQQSQQRCAAISFANTFCAQSCQVLKAALWGYCVA